MNKLNELLSSALKLRLKGTNYSDISVNEVRQQATERIAHGDADFFIRIVTQSVSGILMHSKKGGKMEYFAVKNGNVFATDFFAPDYRYITKEQFVMELQDFSPANLTKAAKMEELAKRGNRVVFAHNNYDFIL